MFRSGFWHNTTSVRHTSLLGKPCYPPLGLVQLQEYPPPAGRKDYQDITAYPVSIDQALGRWTMCLYPITVYSFFLLRPCSLLFDSNVEMLVLDKSQCSWFYKPLLEVVKNIIMQSITVGNWQVNNILQTWITIAKKWVKATQRADNRDKL